MSQTEQRLGLPLGPNGQLIGGRIVTNSNGDAEWYKTGDTLPTLKSNKSDNYTWKFIDENSITNLKTTINATYGADTFRNNEDLNRTFYSNPTSINSLNGARLNTFNSPTGLNSPQLAKQLSVPGSNNSAIRDNPGTSGSSNPSETNPNQGSPDDTDGQEPGISEDKLREGVNTAIKSAKQRTNYPDIHYPLNLRLENQDCIKFSIIEYVPPGLTIGQSQSVSRNVKLNGNRPTVGERNILGTITLPVPAGITDRNALDWQGGGINEFQEILSSISMQTILGGGAAGASAVSKAAEETKKGSDSLQSVIASTYTNLAVKGNSALQRQFGAILNPNLELLFNSPSLRTFSFNFRFTPREKKESEDVRKIIRYFKQAMSTKRTSDSFILKTPHTFAISYLSKNKEHPYLNKFKECALTECSVNYTPDQSYMTYAENSSMTCYELSLSFQELEPIFDDDYTELDQNEDITIGF